MHPRTVQKGTTLQGTNISHLGRSNIIFKHTILGGDMWSFPGGSKHVTAPPPPSVVAHSPPNLVEILLEEILNTWHVWNPVNYGIFTISIGEFAGFLVAINSTFSRKKPWNAAKLKPPESSKDSSGVQTRVFWGMFLRRDPLVLEM